MKIRHLQNDGTFRPQIRDSLRALVSSDVVNTAVSRKGGYRGSITVVIGAPDEKEFEAKVDLVDWTRFPARIRAVATELRDQGLSGTFIISHENGALKIERSSSSALPVPPLTLYEDYTRKDVHDIFDPDSAFTPSAGRWGIHGIVKIPSRPGDFVLLVTFGQSAGEHVFDEGITASGVLTWQSQPRQGLRGRTIQELIMHDEALNSVYLFLRTAERRPYTFLGRLKYLVHDATREHPVHFQWQILDWDDRKVPLQRINLTLSSETGYSEYARSNLTGLVKTDPPMPTNRKGVSTHAFQARRIPDRSTIEKQNRLLGASGEKLVLDYERECLRKVDRADLADRILHVSEVEGDGAGFDIHSFTSTGEPKFIEVKTTAGPAETPFYMSSNELAFAKTKQAQFYLYRLYDYSEGRSTFYVISGDPTDSFHCTPVQYRVVR